MAEPSTFSLPVARGSDLVAAARALVNTFQPYLEAVCLSLLLWLLSPAALWPSLMLALLLMGRCRNQHDCPDWVALQLGTMLIPAKANMASCSLQARSLAVNNEANTKPVGHHYMVI
ncbi:hypothetical protein GOP47_0000001 [Adiantum capillus-veneris]|uniref:Uncharacterized protein n=1 Tax=Adiantum capillus-veneris TaxID=13818 RepID=A0A9D4VE97_ADICA|nr:hypothetical protein GOP47_0000001 [Adiantum capillus-veneris]